MKQMARPPPWTHPRPPSRSTTWKSRTRRAKTDPTNRRCKVVSLTDAGRDMVRTIDATDDPAPDMLSGLEEAELRS